MFEYPSSGSLLGSWGNLPESLGLASGLDDGRESTVRVEITLAVTAGEQCFHQARAVPVWLGKPFNSSGTWFSYLWNERFELMFLVFLSSCVSVFKFQVYSSPWSSLRYTYSLTGACACLCLTLVLNFSQDQGSLQLV